MNVQKKRKKIHGEFGGCCADTSATVCVIFGGNAIVMRVECSGCGYYEVWVELGRGGGRLERGIVQAEWWSGRCLSTDFENWIGWDKGGV